MTFEREIALGKSRLERPKPYRIVAKRDFGSGPGFWIKGRFVKRGFVVTDGFCNVMPGATWFQEIADAMDALEVWLTYGDSGFWEKWRERREARA